MALFSQDAMTVCVTFEIKNDSIVEKDESFPVDITVPGHNPSSLQAIVTITDDDDSKLIN